MDKLKYHIITFGCQMNVSDSERTAGVLEKQGMSLVDKEGLADVVVVNACSVRQKAIDRIWGKLNEFDKIKKTRTKRPLYTVLTGCVLPTDRPKFSAKFDLYFPMKELPQLPQKLSRLIAQKGQVQKIKLKTKKIINPTVEELLAEKQINYRLNSHNTIQAKVIQPAPTQSPLNPISQAPGSEEHYLQLKPKYANKFSAFVPIMTGCNAFCTYCAVPYTRGREVSRKPQEIIEEVEKLLANGYVEITLLGQIINKYSITINSTFLKYLDWKLSSYEIEMETIPELGEPLLREKKLFKFHHLLAILANLGKNFWLRFTSSHPKWFSQELIDTIKRYDNIVEHVHLPVQAGADTTLKRMLRPYKIDEYKKIISYVRKQMPAAAITTDVIVGFCDETDDEFSQSKKLFSWAKYDMAFIAQYSPRPGTKAQLDLRDNVPQALKKQREEELTDILRGTALENNQKYLNQVIDVLITSIKDPKIFGRTRTNKNIRLASSIKNHEISDMVGKFVKVKITNITPWSLEGELT